MLARRTLPSARSIATAPSLSRPFTTGLAHQYADRAPGLSDIRPDSASTFDAKQAEFRKQLSESQRRKEQQESKLSASDVTSASGPPSSSFPALGKLSTVAEEARQREAAEGEGKKKSGVLSSLVYGTQEGRDHDKEIERSFSQVLARGKYVHSIVFHEVKPDKVADYVELVGQWYPKMASLPENKVHLVGSWRTEVGDCDTFGTFSNVLY